ncbi:MAG: four helix bundle protein [Patescibacteria group bacterium]|jgi:four helix bundle protein|nr:four helix bundle protein [Patescibacteria group bacterium]
MGNYSTNNFEDLEAWQKSIDLAVKIYSMSKSFPKDELFGITSQIKRAVSSISANLAEGYGRHGYKEKIQFYKIANGSLLEVKSFCYLSNKLGYISKEELDDLLSKIVTNQKLINALIRSVRDKYEVK